MKKLLLVAIILGLSISGIGCETLDKLKGYTTTAFQALEEINVNLKGGIGFGFPVVGNGKKGD